MSRWAASTARAAVLSLVVGVLATLSLGAPARADNPITPGDFTGYGFDQCLAPTGKVMNEWLKHSPFFAVGIYISGDSRACRSQPNLTPRWVSSQLERGWRLLPITLGPQASCQPRFPRYGDDETIRPKRGKNGRYGAARKQGTAEATKTVGVAKDAGHRPGQHAVVRPRGLRQLQHRLPRVRAGVPQRLDHADPRPRLRLRRLLQRRVRPRGARQRPGQPSRRVRPARPDLARPLGRRREHVHVVPPRGRLAAARPDQAVPGRPRRDLGQRQDQHRPQLPRRRPGLVGGAGGALQGRAGEPPELPPAEAGHRGQHAGPGAGPDAAVPAQGARHVRREGQRRLQQRHHRRRQRVADRPRHDGQHDLGPAQLDDAAHRRRPPGAEVRLRGPGGPPRPAHPQRRQRHRRARRQRHLQRRDPVGAADLAGPGRRRRRRHRRPRDLDRRSATPQR